MCPIERLPLECMAANQDSVTFKPSMVGVLRLWPLPHRESDTLSCIHGPWMTTRIRSESQPLASCRVVALRWLATGRSRGLLGVARHGMAGLRKLIAPLRRREGPLGNRVVTSHSNPPLSAFWPGRRLEKVRKGIDKADESRRKTKHRVTGRGAQG